MENKVAFVLSGGGAKGAHQAGVIAQLTQQGIIPDTIYGTSVGSINALAYSYIGAKELINWWLDLKGRKEVLTPHGIEWLYKWIRVFYKDGIYSTKPLRKVLTNAVNEGLKNEKRFCTAVSCYVDLLDAKTKYTYSNQVTHEEFIDSVISSSTIPLIMETYNNRIDGGAREHTPLQKAIDDGFKEIYVILASPFNMEENWKNKSKIFPWFNTLYRAVDDCMIYEIFNNDLKTKLIRTDDVKIHVYAPDRYWMSTLDFDHAKIVQAIEAGYNCKEMKF